jgi:DNA-binding transcriptional LysR family regulator
MRAADVAIWTSEPQQSDLIRRPLFNMKLHAYASSQYIRRHGAPASIDALDNHPFISYSGTPAAHLSAIRWLETAGLNGKAPRRPVFSANSVIAMKYAIRAGIGVGLIPDYLTGDESDLVPVLQEAQLPTLPVYFVYPEELKTAKKVQVFRDFLVAKARQWKF